MKMYEGLLEVIAKSLVDPDEVVVTEKETEKGLVQAEGSALMINKVISKQEQDRKSNRSVVKAAASRENKQVRELSNQNIVLQDGVHVFLKCMSYMSCNAIIGENMEDLLRVGVISSAHGIKGEVNVFRQLDEPKMFAHWKTLRLVEKTNRLIHVRGKVF